MAAAGRDTVLFGKPAQLVKKPANIDGTLRISHQYVHWQPLVVGSSQEVKLIVGNITGQQKAKGKPFLRIVSSTGSPVIFQFSSEADRDVAVEILSPLVTGSKDAPSSSSGTPSKAVQDTKQTGPDAALKEKLLAGDRDLKSLYDQLMQQGAILDAEFWASRQNLLAKAKGKERPAQKTGLSTMMTTDVQPTADGQSNRVTFRITPDMLPKIFAEKPEVHACYLANVPHTLTDRDFWAKFARYEWARRMRQLNKNGKEAVPLTVEDQETLEMFERFRRTEQAERESRIQARKALPVVNLAADVYDSISGTGGFGTAFDGSKEGSVGLSRASAASEIIRDVNRHAAVVLDGIDAEPSSDAATVATALAKAARRKDTEAGKDWDAANHNRWVNSSRREAHAMRDLGAEEAVASEPLRIQDPRKYFDGAATKEGKTAAKKEGGARGMCGNALEGLDPRRLPCPPVKPSLASQVLTEVSLRVQAALAEADDGVLVSDPKDVLLPIMQQELRKQAMLVNELLRHFWALFPVSSPARAQKLERLKESLSKQYDHMQAMQDAAHGSDRIYISQVLRPSMQALDSAFTKYDAEQGLRASKRQKLAAANGAEAVCAGAV